jgi:hypothetical protein
MTQPTAPPSAPRVAHPVTAAAIGLLVAAAICGTLIVPIYARITPKIGDFPFFYFYLLAYMPAVAIVLWVVNLLQRRLQEPTGAIGSDAEVTG